VYIKISISLSPSNTFLIKSNCRNFATMFNLEETNINTMQFNHHSRVTSRTTNRAANRLPSSRISESLQDQSGQESTPLSRVSLLRSARRRLIYIYPLLRYIRRILQAVSDIRAAQKKSVYALGEGGRGESGREKGRDNDAGRGKERSDGVDK